jgi:hypothetical protein
MFFLFPVAHATELSYNQIIDKRTAAGNMEATHIRNDARKRKYFSD